MKETFLTFLLFLIKYSLVAQTVPEKIVAAIDSFSFIQPQEKTYVQTDRAMYAAGETIWFKAYATLNEKPTILSAITSKRNAISNLYSVFMEAYQLLMRKMDGINGGKLLCLTNISIQPLAKYAKTINPAPLKM